MTPSRRPWAFASVLALLLALTGCADRSETVGFGPLRFERSGCTPGSTMTLNIGADGTGSVEYPDGSSREVEVSDVELQTLGQLLNELAELKVDYPRPSGSVMGLDILYFELHADEVHWQWNEREQPEEIEDLTILLNSVLDGA